MDPKIKKWRKDINTIKKQLGSLLLSQYFFYETVEMVKKNPSLPQASTFFWWRDFIYAHAMSIGVRRFIDKDPRTISIANLLNDIKNNNRLLTQEYFAKYCTKSIKKKTDREARFEEKFGQRSKFIQKKFIEEHIKTIEKISKRIKKFTDKRVAHLDRNQSGVNNINYGMLDDSLAELEKIIIEWQFLLKGINYMTLRASVTDNWKRLFTSPWITPPNSTNASQQPCSSEHLSTSGK
jgi:hypothetical protein